MDKLLSYAFYAICIAVIYLLGIVIYFILKKYAKSVVDKKRLYTFSICQSDSNNYDLIFSGYNRNTINPDEKMLIESKQIGAIQYFDKLAIGIKNGVLDETIMYEVYCRYFKLALKEMKFAFITYSNNINDSTIFIEFFKLANKWSIRKENENV